MKIDWNDHALMEPYQEVEDVDISTDFFYNEEGIDWQFVLASGETLFDEISSKVHWAFEHETTYDECNEYQKGLLVDEFYKNEMRLAYAEINYRDNW